MAMGALMLPSAEDDMFALQRANRVGNHAGKFTQSGVRSWVAVLRVVVRLSSLCVGSGSRVCPG
jgi:hypothetical protein